MITGNDTEKTDTDTCWEFFDCPDEIRRKCKVFINWEKESKFCEGWLYYDNKIGGPAGRGPCHDCSFMKSRYTEMGIFFDRKE